MKRIITLMGVLGVLAIFQGCSDSGSSPLKPNAEEETSAVSSSSEQGTVVSSSAKTESPNSSQSLTTSSSSATGESISSVSTDTIKVVQYITDDGTLEDPYFSSGIFCWTANCEAEYASSSSMAESSAAQQIVVTGSSSSAVPPTVTGNQMADNRNGKIYSLQTIAGTLWMAENLDYETSSGSYCSVSGGDDMCKTYGHYYTYAAAKRACPEGFRLPTEAEVEAADAEVAHEWWQVGGRFKLSGDEATEFGMAEEQGYIWIAEGGSNDSFRVKNYSGDEEHAFQGGTSDRAYNVRCVQGN